MLSFLNYQRLESTTYMSSRQAILKKIVALLQTWQSAWACIEHYLADNPEGVSDLVRVVEDAASRNRTVCLTCFEKDVKDCHRSVLVKAMKRRIRN